jgi:hypothetical protein
MQTTVQKWLASVPIVAAALLAGGATLSARDLSTPDVTLRRVTWPPHSAVSPLGPDAIYVQLPSRTSLLQRRDPPPPIVRPQLVSIDPAGDDLIVCVVATRADTGGNPRATPAECVAEITDTLSIWYRDFEGGDGKLIATISVAITQPDGTVRRSTITEEDRGEPFYLRPGTPIGRYEFVASAGGRSVKGGFTVKAPVKRILLVPEDSSSIAAGKPVTVHLAGYRPSESVKLYLYRWLDHRDVGTGETIFQYATLISETTTDRRGEAVITFPTEPDDPPGTYLVYGSPEQENSLHSGIFDVTK